MIPNCVIKRENILLCSAEIFHATAVLLIDKLLLNSSLNAKLNHAILYQLKILHIHSVDFDLYLEFALESVDDCSKLDALNVSDDAAREIFTNG